MSDATHWLIRDHVVLIVIISSMISMVSGVFLTRVNAKKDQEMHDVFLKQELYINFVVHQLQVKLIEKAGEVEPDPELIRNLRALHAELLIKADLKLLKEITKLKHLTQTTTDINVLLPHIVRVINHFRKMVNNKPLTLAEYKDFIQASFNTQLW
ncbi:MAG: hypothetical protein EKK54_03455 [Neisseriaceae bacterium]|nr:MAG: hypothetical protein EKK54_03455 [Neisseriaceae bacterium]